MHSEKYRFLRKSKVRRANFTTSPCPHSTTRGHTSSISCVDTSKHKAVEVDQVGWASRPPGETHLDILHAQDVPAVVHVLFEVFVLDERERERERVRWVEKLQGHQLQQLSCSAPVFSSSTTQRVMNNNYVNVFVLASVRRVTCESCRMWEGRSFVGLTRYSKTSVSDLSVWMMSCSVTMLACFRSFSNDTRGKERGDSCDTLSLFPLIWIHNADSAEFLWLT